MESGTWMGEGGGIRDRATNYMKSEAGSDHVSREQAMSVENAPEEAGTANPKGRSVAHPAGFGKEVHRPRTLRPTVQAVRLPEAEKNFLF